MKGMNYKEFRESKAAYYNTPEGKLSRADVIKRLESFIVQRQGEGKDYFEKYTINEEK